MSHSSPLGRAVPFCTLLVTSLVTGATACAGPGPEGNAPFAGPPVVAEQGTFESTGDVKSVDPRKPLEVTAGGEGVRITDVTAVDSAGRYVRGELAADGSRWQSTGPLAAGHRFTVRVSTENAQGSPGGRLLLFKTTKPPSDTLNVSFGPEAGAYGVGQPVTAELSEPVKDAAARAVVERNLKVESEPAVDGAWHWVDNENLHYRPMEYWPAHATIRVRSTLRGVEITDKLYGGKKGKPLKLTTRDRIEALTDAGKHRMTVKRNGKVIKTIPVTTGKPGFSTRNGIKVVLGQERYVRMRGTSVGIPTGSSESYDLLVQYATRVTWSGEYVHAAPWSLGSQGYANVSHGCTGMSMGNARWFFTTVRPGDIVEVVNSRGETMTPFGNGFGDWNLSWKGWREGSALYAKGTGNADPTDPTDPADPAGHAAARLHPEI